MKAEYFLSLAKRASKRSDHTKHRLGCCIARGNKVLGVGHNMMKTHPKSPHSWGHIHAEFLAVLNSGYDVEGATAYVYREQKDGSPAMSRPCKYCWDYLISKGITTVVYSFKGSFVQEKL